MAKARRDSSSGVFQLRYSRSFLSIKLQHILGQPDDLLAHLRRVENFDFGAEAEQVAACLVFDLGPARIVLPPSAF